MTPLFLGIDTSNYTTSAALAEPDGRILLNCRLPLPVREGERGLRQSDAVFHHVRNLPEAARHVRQTLSSLPDAELNAAGVSDRPRDAEGSYMPCFLAGVAAAETAAAVHGIPLYRFSHQAGHVMAAVNSVCRNGEGEREAYLGRPFLAFHVSGGTTDLLLVEPDEEKIFRVTQAGGSKDINGGQAVDRTGVRMGMAFPCGAEMDRAALTFEGKLPASSISVDGTRCCLSGLENKAAQLWEKSGDVSLVSAYTLDFIARTVKAMTDGALREYGPLPVLYAGGVMSSRYIRGILRPYGAFADAVYSSDNAAGVACLAAEAHRRRYGL
jgi:N6-L-threonylcarbamoyladenine synthase